jgi:hypothetical protein
MEHEPCVDLPDRRVERFRIIRIAFFRNFVWSTAAVVELPQTYAAQSYPRPHSRVLPWFRS